MEKTCSGREEMTEPDTDLDRVLERLQWSACLYPQTRSMFEKGARAALEDFRADERQRIVEMVRALDILKDYKDPVHGCVTRGHPGTHDMDGAGRMGAVWARNRIAQAIAAAIGEMK